MRNKLKNLSLMSLGFIMAIVIVACGSGGVTKMANAVAAAIGAAIDVTYDNTASGLQSTNVQAAIDEEVTDAKSGLISLTPTALTGTWNFIQLGDTTDTVVDTITLDGSAKTFSLPSGKTFVGGITGSGTISLFGGIMVFSYGTPTQNAGVNAFISGSNLVLITTDNVFVGTKQ